MSRPHKSQLSRKAGQAPGAMVYIGPPSDQPTLITVFKYNAEKLEEKTFQEFEPAYEFARKEISALPQVVWINFDGVHDLKLIEKVGTAFKLHALTLDDLVNLQQRPKREFFEEYLYLVVNMLFYNPLSKKPPKEIQREQVSLIVTDKVLLTFQERNREGDVFDLVRLRLRNGKGKICKLGTDYLAYALADSIVDFYFVLLEDIGERIDQVEEELITTPGNQTLMDLYRLKRELLFFRRSAWPLRELVSGLQREESKLIKPETEVYLKDLYDHVIQIIDTLENERERLSSMLDIYLSSVSNKLNEVMKVLTIMTTIFMPLSLIAGIYGMNFKHMPELEWRWGYAGAIALMIALALAMLVFFRRKKWI